MINYLYFRGIYRDEEMVFIICIRINRWPSFSVRKQGK